MWIDPPLAPWCKFVDPPFNLDIPQASTAPAGAPSTGGGLDCANPATGALGAASADAVSSHERKVGSALTTRGCNRVRAWIVASAHWRSAGDPVAAIKRGRAGSVLRGLSVLRSIGRIRW